ncbi:MAG: 16S rRNA (guanine(966)-N(2))-methyltransferase RsmD [Sporichthyaceae bacterium]
MTRIIAGAARGRRLAVPAGRGTRPTADRAREGLFSTLESLTGTLRGARVLDLYAGSGAVGLEALSRGAGAALMVDSDEAAVRVIRANVDTLALAGAEVRMGRAERLVAASPATEPFDVAFLDPPYELDNDAVRAVLVDALANGWLAPDAVVAVERVTRGGPWTWPAGYAPVRFRRYGEATLWYGHAGSSPAAPTTEV